jgi:hypothetical protein
MRTPAIVATVSRLMADADVGRIHVDEILRRNLPQSAT